MSDHHAVLYIAGHHSVVPELRTIDLASPDVSLVEESPVSIGTVRQLISDAYRRPLVSTHRLFIVSTQSIAPEAQQALLKILEEPPLTARFALVMPSDKGLLPTVLSRVSTVVVMEDQVVENETFREFYQAQIKDRLEYIAERTKAKDVGWMEAIFEGAATIATESVDLELKKIMTFILLHKDQRGASKKMLLEYLALGLPTDKV